MEFLTRLRRRTSTLTRAVLRQPLRVTTLVPAYKVKYLEELLISLQHQTVKPARIIISDDSPDQSFVREIAGDALKPVLAGLNIRVVPGPRSGAYNNFLHLLEQWNSDTELFHFLLDDDIIYPRFYESHVAAHAGGAISCSISRRWTALESGQPIGALPVPRKVAARPQRLLSIDAKEAFGSTVPRCNNWFGELSNVVLRADQAETLRDPRLGGISYTGLEDIGAFLNASLSAPIGFINDHLGYFRRSPQQNSSNMMGRPMKLAHLAWVALAIGGRRVGTMRRTQARKCFSVMGEMLTTAYTNEADMQPFLAVMPALMAAEAGAEDRFLHAWDTYRAAR